MDVDKKFYIIVLVSLFLFACGKNETITSVGFKPVKGLYSLVTISNNQLYVKTRQNMNVRFEYYNRSVNNEKYYGWLAGTSSDEFLFHLPVNSANQSYAIKIRIENATVYQDTTLYFTSTSNNYSFLEVHYIDVKQGDGMYIKTPDEKRLMIDGGYGSYGDSDQNWQGYGQTLALNYVESLGISHFNYLIETHHHADHYGGLNDIINSGDFSYDFYLSNNNSFSYQEGQDLILDSPVQFKILNIGYPPGDTSHDQNNTSIVIKMNYNDADYLFMGDAEGVVQSYILTNPWSPSSDVLKVAHHGSSADGTSDKNFLDAVLNQYAKIGILSFGTGNSYGHPHALNRFDAYNMFGTGQPSSGLGNPDHHFDLGTIITYSDGKAIVITSKK